MWIHEDSCNLLNPWWNCATHMSLPHCTPPPAPSQDRPILPAVLESADHLLSSTVLSEHLPEVGFSSLCVFCGFTTFLHQFSDLQPRSVTTRDTCWWPERRPVEGGFASARSDDPHPEPRHRELCAGHHCWPARCFQSCKGGARNSLLLLLPWKQAGASYRLCVSYAFFTKIKNKLKSGIRIVGWDSLGTWWRPSCLPSRKGKQCLLQEWGGKSTLRATCERVDSAGMEKFLCKKTSLRR